MVCCSGDQVRSFGCDLVVRIRAYGRRGEVVVSWRQPQHILVQKLTQGHVLGGRIRVERGGGARSGRIYLTYSREAAFLPWRTNLRYTTVITTPSPIATAMNLNSDPRALGDGDDRARRLRSLRARHGSPVTSETRRRSYLRSGRCMWKASPPGGLRR